MNIFKIMRFVLIACKYAMYVGAGFFLSISLLGLLIGGYSTIVLLFVLGNIATIGAVYFGLNKVIDYIEDLELEMDEDEE